MRQAAVAALWLPALFLIGWLEKGPWSAAMMVAAVVEFSLTLVLLFDAETAARNRQPPPPLYWACLTLFFVIGLVHVVLGAALVLAVVIAPALAIFVVVRVYIWMMEPRAGR